MRKRIRSGLNRPRRTTADAELFGIDPDATVVMVKSSATGKSEDVGASFAVLEPRKQWQLLGLPLVIDAGPPMGPHPDGNRAQRRRKGSRAPVPRAYGELLADCWRARGDAWLLVFLKLPEVRTARGLEQLRAWLERHDAARLEQLVALLARKGAP